MSGRKICLFAQYHPGHRIRAHVVHYVGALQRCGYHTVVACSGSHLPPYEDRAALYETGARIVFRPNRGLDFGAWRHLLAEGYVEGADSILLANDSVFGPYGDLEGIIRRMQAKKLDVWGMIESRQHQWHLQSWFLHFSAAAFRSAPVARVFAQPFEDMDKDEIIQRGELGLGAALYQAGLRCGAVARQRDASWLARRHPVNLMHLDWRYLLLSGQVPFLKADLLRNNSMNLPWARQWETVLRDRLGVKTGPISDFLFEYTGQTPAWPGQAFPVPVRGVGLGVLASYALGSRDHMTGWRAYWRTLMRDVFPER